MNATEIDTLDKHRTIMEGLGCPKCNGFQLEESNFIAGYIQYRCTGCGYVETYTEKSNRAWKKMKNMSSLDELLELITRTSFIV